MVRETLTTGARVAVLVLCVPACSNSEVLGTDYAASEAGVEASGLDSPLDSGTEATTESGVDCVALCQGHCGAGQLCDCGTCSEGGVCLNSVCAPCLTGQVESAPCTLPAPCFSGLQTRTCVGNQWGEYGDCVLEEGPRYYGDGEKHCEPGGAAEAFCLKISAAGGYTTVPVEISISDGRAFSETPGVYLKQPGTSNLQYSGCLVGSLDSHTLLLHLDPGFFGGDLGQPVPIIAEVRSPCESTTPHTTSEATLTQCRSR